MFTQYRLALIALVALAIESIAPTARAAPSDATVAKQIEQILAEEYAQASFGEAKSKLTAALEECKKAACGPAVKAQAHVLLGMIASQLGQNDEARGHFVSALGEDPNAKLPATTTPNIRSLWKEALERAPPPPPSSAEESHATAASPASPASPAKPTGWTNIDAYRAAAAGLAAGNSGDLAACIRHDMHSLELEEQPTTRLHVASCKARLGRLLEALADAQKALQAGIKSKDAALTRVAKARVVDLIAKIPHVTFVPPPNAEDLAVTLDGRAVPIEALQKKFSVEPGAHVVRAEATVNGLPMTLEKTYTVKAGELLTVPLVLEVQSETVLTPGQLRCMLEAKTSEAVQKCLPQNEKALVVKAETEISAYADTLSVLVMSPRVKGQIASPTAGWNVGGSYLVDVFTAASPDIESYASPKYKETRHAVSLTGGYKPGLYGLQAGGNVSREPDYLSLNANIAATADLMDKLVTPRLAFSYGHDTIGFKSLSPPYAHPFVTFQGDAGVTLVMSPTTVLILNTTLQFEQGDQSKPYRFVPLFEPQDAAIVRPGELIKRVNDYRNPIRVQEHLPLTRQRYAFGARLAKRFPFGTLRLEERLYTDSWGIKSTTTDTRFVLDLGRQLRVWPHGRLHAQTGAGFYQLAYAVDSQRDPLTLPLYRTGDRELSPLMTLTAGAGARLALSAPESKTQFAITLQADYMYSKYSNLMFIIDRNAIYSTLGIEAEFE